jgi:pimeloyl-ACP methyl ester carboxylesterase
VVVFEAGMGASRNMWGAVAPLVAERTSTVVYDRSGLGRSPADAQPRTLHRLADDLGDVLDHLGAGPFVLVGHSWGGPIVRVEASRTPERIAGVVLVDATDEDCELFYSKANERQSKMMIRFGPAMARLGLIRLGVKKLAVKLPQPAADRMRAEDGTVGAVRTMGAELVSCIADTRALRADPPQLPDVPVTVISGMVTTRVERGRRPELIAAHRARAAAHPRGRHVEATASSHNVPFTEPELIAAEIARILDA